MNSNSREVQRLGSFVQRGRDYGPGTLCADQALPLFGKSRFNQVGLCFGVMMGAWFTPGSAAAATCW